MQQSEVQKHLEILMDDWARLWGVNLGGLGVYYDCSYCQGPTSLPVVSEGLRIDMGHEGRCVDGPEIETFGQEALHWQAADLIHSLLTRIYQI